MSRPDTKKRPPSQEAVSYLTKINRLTASTMFRSGLKFLHGQLTIRQVIRQAHAKIVYRKFERNILPIHRNTGMNEKKE